MKNTLILAAMLAGPTAVSLAQTERDLESHEHGAAALNIAIDEAGVYVELDTPWMNLVGFEHSPGTPEQQAQVDKALVSLDHPQQLFLFTGATCTIVETDVDTELDSEMHDAHDSDEDHAAEHEEDEDHAAEHEKDEDHDDHSAEHGIDGEESHSSVSATYEYSCPDVAQLESVELSLLKLWPGIEHLEVQLIGPGGQALEEASAGNVTLDLRQVQ